MKGRDWGRIHSLKGVGVEIFWLVTENSLSRYQKGVSATQTWRGWKDTSAPTFKSGRGTIAPHLTPPGLLRPWRWPAMTRTFHFYDVYNAKPGSLLRVKITTVFISCIFLHHHHKSASQSEVNWRNRKKLFETYARFRHKQITVDKASLSVFQEQKSKVISNVYILRA